jgi:hypothetical protein
VAGGVEGDADQAGPRQHQLRRAARPQLVETAGARQRFDDEQGAAAVHRQPLRPPEPGLLGRHRAIRCDAIEMVARRQRRPGDVKRVVVAEGEMERGDARRQRREDAGPSLGVDFEDRPGAIADKQRAVAREREPARHAQIVRERLRLAVRRHAVDGAFEAAGDVETVLRIDRQRRRVDDPRRERLARAVGTHAEDGDRHLLPARAAVGDVEIVVVIEDGVVHLVEAGGERGGDVDREPGLVGGPGDVHRRPSAVETGRHDRRQLRGRGIDKARGLIADAHLGQRWAVDRKSRAFDSDAPAFNRAQRMDGGDTDRHAALSLTSQGSTLNVES